MTRITRLAFASLVPALLLGSVFVTREPVSASSAFTVTVSPAAETVGIGELAVFKVKVEGQTTNLPSFNFDVEGGSLAAVASIDPTAANVAEGAVFVTRGEEGTARLSVRLGSETLATGQARFAPMGRVKVSVTLNAGPDAAARTWRFDVLSASGQIVSSLFANTSGDAATDVVSTPQLPYGFYTVRQVLGSDTRPVCAGGAFYQVAAPVSGETTLQLAAGEATANFTILPCPDLPAGFEVNVPIDTLVPAPGTVGDADFLPGETPVSEVRGTRQEGPGNPLPPSVGNTAPRADTQSNILALLLLTSVVAISLPAAAWSAAAVRRTSRR